MPSLEPSPRTRLPRQDTSTTSASMASPRAGDASPRELDARVEGAVEQELLRLIHSERQLYGETVSDLRRTNIPDNGNTGSILISGDGELLVSNAYSHTSRSNLTISHSADGAEWSPRVLVNPGASGYSSMANIPQAMRPGGQSVGIAFERNGGFCPKDSYIGKMVR